MDFLAHKETDSYQLIIASIDELCPEGNSKRQKEVLSSQKIIEIVYPKDRLEYDKHGAPQLSNGKAVSISHSNGLIALLIGKQSAAIDLEMISEKALKISPKFLSKEELALAKDAEHATLLWSAKECLFKIYKKGGLTFSKDLAIHSITKSQIECSLFEQKFTLHYEKLSTHWLVYYFD